eukprot:scaffold57188_cov59-Phaeocystis_antarctica.AAC.3
MSARPHSPLHTRLLALLPIRACAPVPTRRPTLIRQAPRRLPTRPHWPPRHAAVWAAGGGVRVPRLRCAATLARAAMRARRSALPPYAQAPTLGPTPTPTPTPPRQVRHRRRLRAPLRVHRGDVIVALRVHRGDVHRTKALALALAPPLNPNPNPNPNSNPNPNPYQVPHHAPWCRPGALLHLGPLRRRRRARRAAHWAYIPRAAVGAAQRRELPGQRVGRDGAAGDAWRPAA